MNSLRCAAAVYLPLARRELQLPPAALFGGPSKMSLKEPVHRRFHSPSNSADIHAVSFDFAVARATQKWK